MIKRLEQPTAPTGEHDGDEEGVYRAPKELRRLLRESPGVQMWQIEEVQPRPGHKDPMIRYEVTSGGTEKIFSRAHEAWEYFRQLTDAPERLPEPGPPRGTSRRSE
jgi:hypothetical protein